jgi:hypothetical protein
MQSESQLRKKKRNDDVDVWFGCGFDVIIDAV